MSDGPTQSVKATCDELLGLMSNITISNYISWVTPSFKDLLAPKDFPDKETVLGYVEAWRWWPIRIFGLNADGIRDYFPVAENFTDRIWSWSGENVADDPPAFNNNNGFYAYNLEGVEDHEQCQLFGRVALYGDVLHCKYGYRAEKARIIDIWVDKDFTHSNPEAWDTIKDIPQVKGVYDTHDPSICNSRGEKEDYQCLILEHQKELSGTSLSDGRMINLSSNQTMLVIDRHSSNRTGYIPPRNPFMYESIAGTRSTSAMNEDGINLWPDSNREWVVKPEGIQCDLCDRMIGKNDVVTVSFEMPDNFMQAIHDRTFEWKRKTRHMICDVQTWFLGIGYDIAPYSNNSAMLYGIDT